MSVTYVKITATTDAYNWWSHDTLWHATDTEMEYKDDNTSLYLQPYWSHWEWGRRGFETAEEEVKRYANPAFHLLWLLYKKRAGEWNIVFWHNMSSGKK